MGNSISTAGAQSTNIPSISEMNSYASNLKGKSETDLLSMRAKATEPWQKDAIDQELQNRATANQQAAGGSSDSGGEDIKKLMKKLEDGTITDAELKQLAGMLHVDPTQLEGMKGKGGSSSDGSGASGGEIQGG